MTPDHPTSVLDDLSEPVVLGPGIELPADLAARVKSEIQPGERLLWAGRATPEYEPAGWGTFAAVVGAAGYTALGVWMGKLGGAFSPVWDFDTLAGAFFALAIGAMIACLTVVARRSSRDTSIRDADRTYALTDRRAIVWRPSHRDRGVEVHVFDSGRIARIHRIERPDDSGDVIFTEVGTASFTSLDFVPDPNGFFAITDVRRVEALARSVLIDPIRTRDEREGRV